MKANDNFSVQAMLTSRRENALNLAEARKKELEQNIPELSAVYREIGAIIPKLLALGIEGGADYEEKSMALHREHQKLIEKKKALIKSAGYSEDYDLPEYTCRLCNDTGNANGKLCRCVKEAKAKHAYYTSGLGKALENQSFDTLDMRYYTGTTSQGISVKRIMENLVDYCKDYAESFVPGAENLLFIGSSGLGKTHIASSIGKAVIDKGYSVVYESAQKLVDAYEAERFGRGESVDTGRFLSCDLLIIDDLGTEFNTQYTLSVLFNVLNYRIINGLSTIVTTNLGFAEIENNYKERIYSRLRGEYHPLIFCGEDIRRLKGK